MENEGNFVSFSANMGRMNFETFSINFLPSLQASSQLFSKVMKIQAVNSSKCLRAFKQTVK
jgi:hypothetical protein